MPWFVPARDGFARPQQNPTTLFAALDVLEGTVIGRCMQRHRHQEFIRFLNAIEAEVPAGKVVHVILDNYAAHKHSKVMKWLGRHPRFMFHFNPISACCHRRRDARGDRHAWRSAAELHIPAGKAGA
jgi:hypothetical protein